MISPIISRTGTTGSQILKRLANGSVTFTVLTISPKRVYKLSATIKAFIRNIESPNSLEDAFDGIEINIYNKNQYTIIYEKRNQYT